MYFRIFLVISIVWLIWKVVRKIYKTFTKKSFRNKVVLVTGGAQGIGLSFVKRFLKEKCTVIVWDISPIDYDLMKKTEKLVDLRKLDFYNVDVSNRELIEKTAREVIKKYGGVDVIINNAGVTVRSDILDVTPSRIEKIFGINFFGQVWVIRSFLPNMIERGEEGHISCMSSSGGLIAIPNSQVYSSTKFALFGLMESLRMQLKKEKIKIDTTIICPAYVDTDLTKELKSGIKKMSPDSMVEKVFNGMTNREELIVLPVKNKYLIYLLRFLFDPWVLDYVAKIMGLWTIYDSARKDGGVSEGLRGSCFKEEEKET